MTTEIWTIRKLLNWTTSYFKKSGIKTARLDAEILLSYTLNCQRIDLYLDLDRPISKKSRNIFKSLIKRRARHEPIAYIVNKKEFRSLELFINKNVLIPRPETEGIIDIIKSILKEDSYNFIDMGTGSGCIAISLAMEYPKSQIFAVDISEKALSVAKENIGVKGLSDRVKCVESCWFEVFPLASYKSFFHAVLSNPPYIPEKILKKLPPEISIFEPSIALNGGLDGLDAYRILIKDAYPRLRKRGFILLEIFESNADRVCHLLKSEKFESIEIVKDDMKAERFIIGFKG